MFVINKILLAAVLLLVFLSNVHSATTNEWLSHFKSSFSQVYTSHSTVGWWMNAFTKPQSSNIIDISMPLDATTTVWDVRDGAGPNFRTLVASQRRGDPFQVSVLNSFTTHMGTHVDSPGHFILKSYETGKGVESLDLSVLNGPVLVVEIPAGTNLTAHVINSLKIPTGTSRIIFKTENTAKQILLKTNFETSYVAFTADGAEAFVANYPEIRMLGIDSLSIATYEDVVRPHVAILSHGIIPVEGLVLTDVKPGLYTVHCLPLKIVGSDGGPARCILLTS